MKFLIQTFNGEVEHDFSLALIESIKYSNWLYDTNEFEYLLINELDDLMVIDSQGLPEYFDNSEYVPIGSVEFVSDFIKRYYNIDLKPINIPYQLMCEKYTKRKVINGTEKDIIGKKFVKSNEKIKSFTEITDIAPPGNYQISEIIEIESEYRCFVYKNRLVGIQNYLGDFKIFPDIDKIEKMISVYDGPVAYTLDVGITDKNETVIIEVHDFFSVGFYGFNEYKIIPFMFKFWFDNMINK